MADANSDSDDGVYCELKEYIKQARMNLRKVKKNKPVVAKEDEDTDEKDEDEIAEANQASNKKEIEQSENLNLEDDNEEEDIKDCQGRDSEPESDKGQDTDNDDESIEKDNEKTQPEQDEDMDKPNEYDNKESDKEDIETSDNNAEIVEIEHEENNDEIQENMSDDDDQNTDSAEEQNCDETRSDSETHVDDEKADKSVNDIKNMFETNNESISNNGTFRSFKPIGNDHESKNINEAHDGEETNDGTEKINESEDKQNTDDELKASNDDSPTIDAFNIQYRYALRYSKRMNRSQQPNEEMNDDNNLTETVEDSTGVENTEDSVDYNSKDGRVSSYHEYLQIDKYTIERLYDFVFHNPWQVLNQILDSKRSSNSSTEIDGIMSSPQKIFYTNEEIIQEKTDEIELEDNIENVEDTEKVDLRLNTRALTKEAKTYELERFDKNILIIFNQERIVGYKPRFGTRQDVEALTQTFSPYGFDVIEHLDLNRDEIFEELKRLTEMNFTDYGCLAIAVLTHGSEMDGLRAKDRLYYQNDIIKYLKTSENPTLVTKPKVLIIQACRGSESTFAVSVGRVGKITKDYDDLDEHRTYTLPVEADILIVHSTFAGKTSHRDELNGTWFIQTLCNKINELALTEDLESIITEVKKEVAIEKSLEEYNRRTFDFDTNKQIPVIVSTLIRKLYLKKLGDTPEENAMTDGSNPVSSSRLTNCLCVFDKFEYLKNCMRYFLEDNDDDVTGRSFLDVAETLTEDYEFHAIKDQLSKAMSNHLMTMAKDCDYYKYLYFYKDGS